MSESRPSAHPPDGDHHVKSFDKTRTVRYIDSTWCMGEPIDTVTDKEDDHACVDSAVDRPWPLAGNRRNLLRQLRRRPQRHGEADDYQALAAELIPANKSSPPGTAAPLQRGRRFALVPPGHSTIVGTTLISDHPLDASAGQEVRAETGEPFRWRLCLSQSLAPQVAPSSLLPPRPEMRGPR